MKALLEVPQVMRKLIPRGVDYEHETNTNRLDQDLVYSEPGVIKDSLAQHLVCTPMQFRCAPGERKLIRYTLTIPDQTGAGEHTVGIQALEVVIPPRDAGSGRINVGVAVKCGFLCAMSIMVPGVEGKAVEPVSLEYVARQSSQAASIDLCIKNEGFLRARPKWSFQVFDQSGKKVLDEDAGDYLILRQSQRVISCPLKTDLIPGKYRFVGRLDQGLPYPVQELEKEFEVGTQSLRTEQTKPGEGKP